MKQFQIIAMLLAVTIMTTIYYGIITLATVVAGVKVLASLRLSGALLVSWVELWDYFNKKGGLIFLFFFFLSKV